jgi:hypothetical protein
MPAVRATIRRCRWSHNGAGGAGMTGPRRLAARFASISVLGLELPFLALWFGLATVLSLITWRVTDWNDMTDELVWERLAVSVGQFHSILPRLHGEVIRSLSQLYPLLIAPWFWHGYVTSDIRNAHLFDAWLMSSAAIPAFLLAKRVTGRRWPAYLLAVVVVCTPWILYSTVLLTEVAAYPAFAWALFLMHRTLVAPSWGNDLLALLGIALAFFARTQLGLLLAVLPVAIVLYHLTARRQGPLLDRVRAGIAGSLRGHSVLLGVYVVLAAVYLGYRFTGHQWKNLTLYGSEGSPKILATSTLGSMTGHAADFAFGVGILPFVVGWAWLLSNALRSRAGDDTRAFACVGAAAGLGVLTVVSAWDLTLGNYVIDRYLFYLVPITILGFLCALLDERRPRWSLLLPVGFVCYGYATRLQPDYLWSGQFPLSMDSPIATPYKWVADLGNGDGGASAILVGLTIAAAALFLLANHFLSRRRLTIVLSVVMLVAFPVDTAYAFSKLFSRNGSSGRPLTAPEAGVLDWLDRIVGTNAKVTEVPYPTSSSFFESQEFWRDMEFWNKSIRYDVHYPTPDVYDDAVVWFPNTPLSFDAETGRASASPTPYVVQAVGETRFRISGNDQYNGPGVMLIDATMPWRTDWLTYGLYDDGWTEPGKTVRIRVFAVPGQKRALTRGLSIQIRPPEEVSRQAFTIRSNLQTIHDDATSSATSMEETHLCLPAKGYTEVTLQTKGSNAIPGDMRNEPYSVETNRRGGLQVADIALSDDVGAPCTPKDGGG